MRYSTVLFDADGTLLDFHRGEREAVKEALALSGICADDEMVRVYSEINDGLWKALERGEIERSVLLYRRFELFCEHYGYEADAKRIAKDYMDTLSTKAYLLDGVVDMLDRLYGKVRMYIVTNGIEYIQTRRYARTGIQKYFDGIFISECIGSAKPSPDYFAYVEKHVDGFDVRSTIVIGDSLTSDIKGGNNYGIDTCWYNPDNKECGGIADPTYEVRDFDDVVKIIFGEDGDRIDA